MFIDAIDRKAVKLINRAHPLRVTFRQVIVDSYNMNSSAGKSIKKNRQRSDNRFTFTCRHLCNLSLMKRNSSKELDVIVNHIPDYLIPACDPTVFPVSLIAFDCYALPCRCKIPVILHSSHFKLAVFLEPPGSLLHYCKSLWNTFIKNRFQFFIDLLLDLVYLVVRLLFLVNIFFGFSTFFNRFYSVLIFSNIFQDLLSQLLCFISQLII